MNAPLTIRPSLTRLLLVPKKIAAWERQQAHAVLQSVRLQPLAPELALLLGPERSAKGGEARMLSAGLLVGVLAIGGWWTRSDASTTPRAAPPPIVATVTREVTLVRTPPVAPAAAPEPVRTEPVEVAPAPQSRAPSSDRNRSPAKSRPRAAPTAPTAPVEPPAPAPAPSMAGRTVTTTAPAMAVPAFDLTQGDAPTFVGGMQASQGTRRNHAVSDAAPATHPRANDVEAAPNPAAPAHSLAQGPRPRDSGTWQCPWPSAADVLAIDEKRIALALTIDARGRVVQAQTKSDPGYGFAHAAEHCAREQMFEPALDRGGRPVQAQLGVALVFRRYAVQH